MGLLAWTITARAQCSQSGLVLDVPVNNGMTDQSAFSHTVTVVGNPSYGPGHEAAALGAVQFGAGKYATVPASPAFEALSDGFTISAWVNPTSLTSFNSVITKLNGNHRDIDMRIHSDRRVQVHFTNSNLGITAVTTDLPVVQLQVWQHLAATWDGAAIRIYVNGVLEKELVLVEGPDFQANGPIAIGALDGTETLNGYLDDIQVRSYPLTVDEIACLVAGSTPANQGVVLQLPLNGSGADISVNANNGTLTAVADVADRWEQPASAGSFNGTSSRVVVPISAAYNTLGQAFTISAWIQVTNGTGEHTIIGKTGSGRDIVLRVQDSKLTAHYYIGSYVWCIAPTATLTGTAWHHVACIWDGTRLSIYHNGEMLQSTTPVTGPTFTSNQWSIGSLNAGGQEYFQGNIDDVIVWDRALTLCELREGIVPFVDLLPNTPLTLCAGQTVQLTAPSGYCAYEWVGLNGAAESFDVNANDFTVGDHQIVLRTYDDNDIVYTDTVELNVSLCTGIDQTNQSNAMKLIPNPATNVVSVSCVDLVQIQMLDVSGRLLNTTQVTDGNQTDIDVSNLPSGIYFIEGIRADGTTQIERLMKH